jgi:hypothetical protein
MGSSSTINTLIGEKCFFIKGKLGILIFSQYEKKNQIRKSMISQFGLIVGEIV